MSDLGNTVNVQGYMGDVAILETDKQLLVQFHKVPVLNPIESKRRNTPIYEERDYCKIIRPGEPHSIWDQPARELDKLRFAAQWKAYVENKDQVQSGTPLNLLFPDNPAVVATLNAMHVHTVQQLATISDNAIGNVQFGHDLREKARAHVKSTERAVDADKLEAELTEQRNKTAALEAQVAELLQKRKGGRPKKNQEPVAQAS